eukprot:591814_1
MLAPIFLTKIRDISRFKIYQNSTSRTQNSIGEFLDTIIAITSTWCPPLFTIVTFLFTFETLSNAFAKQISTNNENKKNDTCNSNNDLFWETQAGKLTRVHVNICGDPSVTAVVSE